jgi:hypothetical protein
VSDVAIDGSGLAEGCAAEAEVVGVLFDGAGGAISGVSIADLGRGAGDACGSGVVVQGEAAAGVTVEGATISGGGQYGIVARRGAEVSIAESSIIDAAQYGVIVYDKETRADIRGTTVTDAGEIGIAAAGGAAVDVTGDNRVSGGKVGIRFTGVGTTGTVGGATVANAVVGIFVLSGASAEVTGGNRITGCSVGILFQGRDTRGVIDGNVVEDATEQGIVVTGGAEASVTDNLVTNAGNTGIVVAAAVVEVSGNTVVRPARVDRAEAGPIGIEIGSGKGRVAENTVSGYFNDDSEGRACGILIFEALSTADVSGNHFPDPGNEIDVCKA